MDEAVQAMLRHDINFERTCSLEDGKTWRKESERRAAINKYCSTSFVAMEVWRSYFINCNTEAQKIFTILIQAKVYITDGIVEAVISNV